MENKELLTGRCKADFEEWVNRMNFYFEYTVTPRNQPYYQSKIKIDYEEFELLPQTMQQGVLLEFFRERGMEIYWNVRCMYGVIYEFEICRNDDPTFEPIKISNPDYSTAFTHAIDKACEIYGGEG